MCNNFGLQIKTNHDPLSEHHFRSTEELGCFKRQLTMWHVAHYWSLRVHWTAELNVKRENEPLSQLVACVDRRPVGCPILCRPWEGWRQNVSRKSSTYHHRHHHSCHRFDYDDFVIIRLLCCPLFIVILISLSLDSIPFKNETHLRHPSCTCGYHRLPSQEAILGYPVILRVQPKWNASIRLVQSYSSLGVSF